MTPELIKEISAELFRTVLYVSGPPLFMGLVVGLLVGIFQTVTQIQEFTLTFVPKMLSVFLLLFIMMPWLTDKLVSFTINLITNIPTYVR